MLGGLKASGLPVGQPFSLGGIIFQRGRKPEKKRVVQVRTHGAGGSHTAVLKKPVSTAAIHTHRLATPRRCQAGRHCKGPTAGHLPRGSAAQRRRFPACFRQLGSMRVPARLLRRRRPQLAEGGEGRRTASDRKLDRTRQVDRRGVVQHLLQFRVVVTCKTTVCRKQGRAGLYRSVYTLQLQTAPTNQLGPRYYSLEIDTV